MTSMNDDTNTPEPTPTTATAPVPSAAESLAKPAPGPISRGDMIALACTAIWMIAMVIIGISLVSASSPQINGPTPFDYEAYGGDAYTGIQNAAVDTAATVAEAANAQLAAMDQIQHGLGWLLIASGLIVFTLVYQRYVGVRLRS